MKNHFFISAVALSLLNGCVVNPAPYQAGQYQTGVQQNAANTGQVYQNKAVAGLPMTDMAAAQRLLSQDETLQTLDFPESGTKTLSGRIEGYKTVVYVLPIRKGQRLEVTMDTKSTAAYFNIKDAKDTSGTALFAGELSGTNTALIRATEDATYVLQPYLNRAAARRNESADYTFKIERQ